jgi:hypothetical protein
MKNQGLTIVEPAGEVARPMESSTFNFDAAFRYAVDKGAGAEAMNTLMNIRRELNMEAAKKAFDEALSAFQSECPLIMKEKSVPTASGKIAYKYAPIEAIEIQIRPLLRQHGFSHTFDTDTASEAGWVIAKCIVTHREGHSRVSTAKFPLGTKTQIMSDTQVYASALTFANRRALSNAYGLVLAGEDLDGQTGKLKPTGPSAMQPADLGLKDLARELWEVLKPVRGTKRDWNEANQWLWREEVLDGAIPETAPDLSPPKFKEVIAKAREILGKGQS